MNAAMLYGREDIRIKRMAMPKAAAGEIVVRVHAALTCGTDLKTYRRGYHAKMLTLPSLFGHELAGTVYEVGEGVASFKEGMRVVTLNSAPCGECYWCERDQENLCEDLLFNNGAYAEFISIPQRIVEKNTLIVPETLALEFAALTEPLACVVRGLEETGAKPGDQVVVIGAGPIGLMFMHVAEIAGMSVLAVVKRDAQVAAARTFGAKEVIQISEGEAPVAAIRALTPRQRGADVAIEAVATPMTWQWAVDMVRRGGVVNFFGGCAAGTKVELDTNRLHYSDITLKATFHHTPATCRRALKLIESGRFKANEYITGRAPLSDLDEVFRSSINRASNSRNLDIKTAIIP